MPPKPKFTREEVVQAALNVVSRKGAEALTAQELRTELNCSASPIFTLFNTMKEIQEEVRIAAMRRFEAYTEAGMEDMPNFKQIGMKMVLFGMHEPKLYQLLFMRENKEVKSFDDLFGQLGTTASMCIETIEQDYALSHKDAQVLFENVWIYTFGVGALCAAQMCHFTKEELSQMLTTQFQAMMMLIKSGNKIE